MQYHEILENRFPMHIKTEKNDIGTVTHIYLNITSTFNDPLGLTFFPLYYSVKSIPQETQQFFKVNENVLFLFSNPSGVTDRV